MTSTTTQPGAESSSSYRAAFPNLRMEPEHVLASGDIAVARVRATGTHRGELMGMPATGRSVDVQLIDIMRFDQDGLVAEQWGVVDTLAVMQQLGVAGGKDSGIASHERS